MKKEKLKVKNFLNVSSFKFRVSSPGFTLIELLVAMAVFSTVVVIVSSIFVSVTGSQRKNVNNQEVIDNARFILESIGRSVRQSQVQSPNSTSSNLTLNHPIKGIFAYSLSGGQVLENGVALSSNNVFVDRLDFTISGVGDDQIQPRVTIAISLRSSNQPAGGDSAINLQTTITPSNLDIATGS